MPDVKIRKWVIRHEVSVGTGFKHNTSGDPGRSAVIIAQHCDGVLTCFLLELLVERCCGLYIEGLCELLHLPGLHLLFPALHFSNLTLLCGCSFLHNMHPLTALSLFITELEYVSTQFFLRALEQERCLVGPAQATCKLTE